eukprot:Rhum_TRINITY_DN14723_c0_g1::Rhum_TRINITY_DN14723_c0_g1_i1::g.112473::m.112473
MVAAPPQLRLGFAADDGHALRAVPVQVGVAPRRVAPELDADGPLHAAALSPDHKPPVHQQGAHGKRDGLVAEHQLRPGRHHHLVEACPRRHRRAADHHTLAAGHDQRPRLAPAEDHRPLEEPRCLVRARRLLKLLRPRLGRPRVRHVLRVGRTRGREAGGCRALLCQPADAEAAHLVHKRRERRKRAQQHLQALRRVGEGQRRRQRGAVAHVAAARRPRRDHRKGGPTDELLRALHGDVVRPHEGVLAEAGAGPEQEHLGRADQGQRRRRWLLANAGNAPGRTRRTRRSWGAGRARARRACGSSLPRTPGGARESGKAARQRQLHVHRVLRALHQGERRSQLLKGPQVDRPHPRGRLDLDQPRPTAHGPAARLVVGRVRKRRDVVVRADRLLGRRDQGRDRAVVRWCREGRGIYGYGVRRRVSDAAQEREGGNRGDGGGGGVGGGGGGGGRGRHGWLVRRCEGISPLGAAAVRVSRPHVETALAARSTPRLDELYDEVLYARARTRRGGGVGG